MPTPYQTALARIRKAAEEGAATLDLSRLDLETLPPSVRSFVPQFVDRLPRNASSDRITSPPSVRSFVPQFVDGLLTSMPINEWGQRINECAAAFRSFIRSLFVDGLLASMPVNEWGQRINECAAGCYSDIIAKGKS